MRRLFGNLKVFYKILCLVILVSLLMGLLGYTGYKEISNANKDLNYLYNERLLSIQYLEEAMVQIRTVEGLINKYFLENRTVQEEQAIFKDINDRAQRYDIEIQQYEDLEMDAFEKERWPLYQEALEKYREERENAFNMRAANREAAFDYFVAKALPHLDEMNTYLRELSDYNKEWALSVVQENNTASEKTRVVMMTIIFVAILASVSIGLIIARGISRPLNHIAYKLQEVAKGNLAIEKEQVKTADEVGILGEALNQMLENLRSLVRTVANMSEQVSSSSEELTASAEQQAQASNQVASVVSNMALGAEKQSDAVIGITSAIEEISASIEQLAATSSVVAEQTKETSTNALEGQKAIKRAIDQMKSIAEASTEVQVSFDRLAQGSKEIDEITNVISGIAGQTNLLALNAAIEAARAGEQGRGFAVVAEEVRKLAEQSQTAAKQIANLISQNQINIDSAVVSMDSAGNAVRDGVEVVGVAGQAFEEIGSLVDTVSSQVDEISASVQQMAQGSQTIVIAVRDVDAISKENMSQSQTVSAATQEQTASVEEIASASQNLASMAESLQESINTFKV